MVSKQLPKLCIPNTTIRHAVLKTPTWKRRVTKPGHAHYMLTPRSQSSSDTQMIANQVWNLFRVELFLTSVKMDPKSKFKISSFQPVNPRPLIFPKTTWTEAWTLQTETFQLVSGLPAQPLPPPSLSTTRPWHLPLTIQPTRPCDSQPPPQASSS